MLGLNTDTPVLMADLFDDGTMFSSRSILAAQSQHSTSSTLCFLLICLIKDIQQLRVMLKQQVIKSM